MILLDPWKKIPGYTTDAIGRSMVTYATKQQSILVSIGQMGLRELLVGSGQGGWGSSARPSEGRVVSAEEATGGLAKCGTRVA